ncbi:hypothetical protein ABPG73_006044 [Tetrahymena malaccensis]
MSSQSIFCYNNNSSYRNQIQVNEEYHKQFQKFPYKQNNDSIVESGTSLYISRRELSAKQDIITQENLQNKTILQALSEAEKEKHQKSEEYKMETSFQTLSNFKSQQNNAYQHKSYLQQTQEQNILNTVFNIEDADQKVEPIRLMKVLKLLVNIQHFFRILSMNARIFNKLNQNQHDLIGDVASVYSKSTKLKNGNKFFDLVLNYWYYMLIIAKNLNIQVFNPSNILIKVWDYLQSMLILFSTFLLNLQLFFEMDISNFQLLFQILFIVSVIDILVELNTGVLQKGDIIYDRNYIFKSYMQDTFFLNVIGNIPLFFFISKVEISTTVRIVFNILYTFNWVKISKVLKQIAYYASYEKGYKNMFDLLKLLVFVIGICHIFCLFWHGLCLFEINSGQQNNWIESKNLLDATIYERYIYSFYFLAVTMATVGYGDITPQNSAEVLFTTITIFVTCVVYAFSLNTIGSIIENIEKKDKKYKDNLQIIHGLMREEEVSRELKIQVSNYIEYLYKESNEIQKKQEKLIIEKLSTKLRNDLILEIQGKYINSIPLFKHIKEKDKIAKIMEEQLYSPGEIIFNQGDQDDSSLYYIVKGSVQIIFNQDGNQNREAKQIKLIKKKEYFGEISFINGNPRTFTAKTADFCRIYRINRQQFMEVIKQHDQDFENFQMIKEAFSLNRNYKFCSIFCSTCKSGNHFSIDCPRTHLTLTRQIVISRYNSCSPQERAEFKRRKSKLNFFQKIEILHNALLEINNKESLFEILDSLENGCNILDEADDETNVQFQDNSKEENIRKNLVDGTQNQLFFSSDNKNSQIENQNKSLSIEECQDKAQNQIIRQGKNNLTLIKQNSKGNRYNDKTIQMQQQQQQQNQVKKQFLYRSSQQYNPENKMIEQLQENQRQQQNESEKLPTSPTSSEDDSMSDCSFQYRKQKPSKDNAQLERPSLGKEDEQRFIIDEKIKEDAIQNNSAIQKRNSSIFYKMRGSNQLINSQINEISRQSLINDVKNNNEKQKEVVNNIQINNILQSRRTLRGTRDNIFLENVLKKIQNRSSLQVDEQNLQKKYSNTNFDDLQERLSKISLKDNPKKLSLQNQFQFLNSKSIQNTANILPQIIEENILINGKKGIDFIEYADQVNYQMLQTFDKAKIFKYYFPHFNYPEIVEKWVLFQSKRQQRILKSSKIAQKKKRYLNKRKQNNSSLYQKQTEI